MANTIVFLDGFDHYAVANIGRKWTSSSNIGTMVTGRNSVGQAMQITTTGSVEKVFASTSQAWRIGMAVNLQSQTGSTFGLINIKDGTSGQVELSWVNNRKWQFSRNGTLVGSATTTTASLSTWYYLEMYVSIKDSISLGNAQLYVNGVQEINLPATTDIKNTANAFADRVNIGCAGFWLIYYDDLVVSTMDDTTTPTFLGDRRVTTLYPDGNGNYSQFVGSDSNSVNNYQLVDETLVDDADYVTSDTAGNKDSYTMSNLAQTPSSIEAVQITANVRKDDAGTRVGRTFFRIGGTDYDSGDIALSTSYQMATYLRETDPSTSAAWTNSSLSSMEVGVKVQT